MNISEVLFWGMFGICTEVSFTAIFDLITKKELNLMGHTSLWMFPIYAFGLSYGFDLAERVIQNEIVRYLSYPIWVWIVEILVGYPLLKFRIRLWDYSYLSKQKQWKGFISFVHFPSWILLGILVEYIKKILI
ncbi:MAG: hypothetical protein HN427_05940 [Flavobacteriales bacterium]|nr:hypothetical protein [Flavobacteriales bacterium]MBT7481451.1 hypothetical protein [Flavobacteriales bacterium]